MPTEFQLEDNDGNVHEYVVTPHPAIDRGQTIGGLQLVSRLTNAAGQAIARLVDSNVRDVLTVLQDEFEEDGSDGDPPTMGEMAEAIEDHLRESDSSLGLPNTVKDFFTVIDKYGADRLLEQLMAHTSRDGFSLKKDANFNAAYTANYQELMQAAWKVVDINGFLGSLVSSATTDEQDEAS